jgi:hypothetical protein
MRTRVLVVAVTMGAALALAAPSLAATTVDVKASFVEGVAKQFGCSVQPDGNCGTGKVLPFGSATETILFGAACGGNCDLRTITVAQGALVLDETFSSPECPGACKSHGVGRQGSGTLTDVVVSGSGIFAGASGTLIGSVKSAGGSVQILLSGQITL